MAIHALGHHLCVAHHGERNHATNSNDQYENEVIFPPSHTFEAFPNGSNWVDWYNTSLVYTGGTTIKRVYPLSQFPAFQQAGAMLPLYVKVEDIGHGVRGPPFCLFTSSYRLIP